MRDTPQECFRFVYNFNNTDKLMQFEAFARCGQDMQYPCYSFIFEKLYDEVDKIKVQFLKDMCNCTTAALSNNWNGQFCVLLI